MYEMRWPRGGGRNGESSAAATAPTALSNSCKLGVSGGVVCCGVLTLVRYTQREAWGDVTCYPDGGGMPMPMCVLRSADSESIA